MGSTPPPPPPPGINAYSKFVLMPGDAPMPQYVTLDFWYQCAYCGSQYDGCPQKCQNCGAPMQHELRRGPHVEGMGRVISTPFSDFPLGQYVVAEPVSSDFVDDAAHYICKTPGITFREWRNKLRDKMSDQCR